MTAIRQWTRILVTAGVLAIAQAGPAAGQTADLEGTLVIVNKGASTVSIVDVGSGTELAVLPTGTGPHEVALTADGRTAVITDYEAREPGNSLTIVDVAARQVTKTIDLGSFERPHAFPGVPRRLSRKGTIESGTPGSRLGAPSGQDGKRAAGQRTAASR